MQRFPENVKAYLEAGCGRCPLGGTPSCKVHRWNSEIQFLTALARSCGLEEQIKWGVPCYTDRGKNVVMVSAFKNYASISFFKGVLLADPQGLLAKPGENSQSSRLIKFYNLKAITSISEDIKSFIHQAIKLERSGKQVIFSARPEPLPQELLEVFETDPAFEAAFEALTPGRQRGYLIYFSSSKNADTRKSRIEKHKPKIFEGVGLHDHYKAAKE